MKKLLIGIDLGTTYSCAAVLNEAGTIEMSPNKDTGMNTTPSTLLFKKDSDSAKAGDAAKSAIQGLISVNEVEREQQMIDGWYVHPKGIKSVVDQAKRFIGTNRTYEFDNNSYNPTFVSAAILKKIKQDVEACYGQEVDEAVITIPANFNSQQRQETIKAANSIGLNVKHLINEPSAAALAYAMSSQIDGIYAVYDFGGGTFDCSIVETKGDQTEILGSDGIKRLGGKDLDLKFLKIVQKKYKDATNKDLSPKQYSIITAEMHKIHLSSDSEVEIFIDGIEILITRKEFEAEISTLISQSMLVFDNAIENAKISVDNVMDVVLVGGSSRIPMVKNALKRKIGKNPKNFGNPDETVAKGAAIYVALKNKKSLNINQKATISGLSVKEITNVFLGTVFNDNISGYGSPIFKNLNLIKKGARIPASNTVTVYIPNQIVAYQLENPNDAHGMNYEPKITESYTDSTSLTNVEIVWRKLVPWPIAKKTDTMGMTSLNDFFEIWCKLKIKYSIDNNQVFHVNIFHPSTNTTLVNESIDMKKGSLNTGSSLSDKNIDEFKID